MVLDSADIAVDKILVDEIRSAGLEPGERLPIVLRPDQPPAIYLVTHDGTVVCTTVTFKGFPIKRLSALLSGNESKALVFYAFGKLGPEVQVLIPKQAMPQWPTDTLTSTIWVNVRPAPALTTAEDVKHRLVSLSALDISKWQILAKKYHRSTFVWNRDSVAVSIR
jgi:hypothetical protein